MIKILLFMALHVSLATDILKNSKFFELQGYKESSDDFEYSTEIFPDHNSVLAIAVQNASQATVGLSIKVIQPNTNNTISSSCFLPVHPVPDIGRFKGSVRRVSRKIVLLLVSEHGQQFEMKLIALNTQNCKYEYVDQYYVREHHFVFTSDNPSDDRFTLIMEVVTTKWVRIFGNPLYQKFDTLYFDLPSGQRITNLEPVGPFDSNIFVVTLFDHVTNIRTVRLYDFTSRSNSSNYKEISAVPDWYVIRRTDPKVMPWDVMHFFGWESYKAGHEGRSSGLAFCWCAWKGKSIHCSLAREDGSLQFNETLSYPESVSLVHVANITNGLILFSKSFDSWKNEDLTVQVDVVRSNVNGSTSLDSYSTAEENHFVQIKHRQYELACYDHDIDAWKIRANESDGSIEVEYLCYNKDNLLGTPIHRFHIN